MTQAELLALNHMRKHRFFRLFALPVFACSLLGMSGIDLLDEPTESSAIPLEPMKTLHDFTVKTIEGEDFDLSQLKGKKVLVVNTASECGLTPQYEQLQELYESFGGDGFEIIGFPSNDFLSQEPGSDAEISSFCQKNYGVTFQMMSKVKVKGKDIHPVYAWLTQKELNGVGDFKVKWNFHKFLVNEEGELLRDVEPRTLPNDQEILDWLKN